MEGGRQDGKTVEKQKVRQLSLGLGQRGGGWGKQQCQGSQFGRAGRCWAARVAALHQQPEVPKGEEDDSDDSDTPTYNLTVP